MKRALLLASALMVLGLQSQAAVLLQSRTGGGMPGPDGSYSSELTLHTNGEVVSTRYRNRQVISNKVVAVIKNESALQRIQARVNELKGGELVSTRPNESGCMDAPSTTYFIFKQGQALSVASRHNCIDYQLTDDEQRWQAEEVKNYLEALSLFSY